ncbi:hypothetical protein [Primorskyibacter sp. S187A]|uniref:hypothetical protein n=1 Tax=Primorskyibacter sp. S187A TaxID=3415130 RepID=UPI003C7D5621
MMLLMRTRRASVVLSEHSPTLRSVLALSTSLSDYSAETHSDLPLREIGWWATCSLM